MFTHKENNNSMFKCIRDFIPASECVEEPDENGEVKIIRKKSKYLPGEKLLLKLNKNQNKNQIDIDKIASSLKRVILSI